MTWILQDIRFALRTLRRRPLFTAVAVTTIALGIGAATSIFSIVDGVLLRPLPFREPARLVAVWQTFPAWKKEPMLAYMWDHITLSLPEFRDLRDKATSFASVGAWAGGSVLLVDGDKTEQVTTLRVSATLLDVLGVRPYLGRMFLPGEDVPNAPPVVLVSYEQWQSRYGGRPDILGTVVHFEEKPQMIIGVLRPRFTIGRSERRDGGAPAFWTPVGQNSGSDYNERTNHSYRTIARLRPGVTMERALQEATILLRDPKKGDAEGTRLVDWQWDQTREARAPLFVLLGAVGLLLMVACANVATLQLGEATTREHEMAARQALGAPRARLVAQLLIESLTLAFAGGVLGAALAWGGTRLLVALAPGRIPGIDAVTMDGRVLAAATLAIVLTGILFGLMPAVMLSRAGPGALLRGGAGQSARGPGTLQRTMIAAELALSVVLLVGAGLLTRSFDRITRVDPGFTEENLLVVQTSLPRSLTRDTATIRAVYDAAVSRMRSLPGVESATQMTHVPFSGGFSSSSIVVEGEDGVVPRSPIPKDARRYEAQQRTAEPGSFAVMRMPLLAGREFTVVDRGGAPNVAIVSEALARRNFPSGSPIGKQVYFQGAWRTIVGVVGDVRYSRLTKDVEPTIYTPFAQRDMWSRTIVVRTAGDPLALSQSVRRALLETDSRLVLTKVSAMDELIRRSFAEERYRTMLISLFGILAVVLASVGMYGVTSRAVARREREVGIRLALGATEWRIVRQIVSYTLAGVGVGIAAGMAGSFALGRAITPFLFGVSATDPATYIAILTLLTAVSIAASWIPARRAGRIAVMRVLRGE
jgi:putative ABC transport system permease protein